MLEQNAFDNICHEHRCYFSLKALDYLLKKHGLEIFYVNFNDINGGSIRTFIKHKECKKYHVRENVKAAMDADIAAGLDTSKPYEEFALRIRKVKHDVVKFLTEQKEQGKTVVGCGASTRGNTTLQFFGITPELMPAIGDSNSSKWGKVTPGSGIPIVSPEDIKKMNPDYQFVLIWHLFEKIKEKEEGDWKFVLPMPEFKIL
jgi:hypothetical protein